MLSMSDYYDSVNEHTQEIDESMKLYILGVWQNAHEIYQAAGQLSLVSIHSLSSFDN